MKDDKTLGNYNYQPGTVIQAMIIWYFHQLQINIIIFPQNTTVLQQGHLFFCYSQSLMQSWWNLCVHNKMFSLSFSFHYYKHIAHTPSIFLFTVDLGKLSISADVAPL